MGPLRWIVTGVLFATLASPTFAQDPTTEPAAPVPAAPVKPAKGIGEPAPRLVDVEWLLGKPLKQFARGTAYVVFFWAPWNVDSVRALPLLAALQKEQAGQRVAVVAIVLADRPEIVPADGWVQRNKAALPFLVAIDVLEKTETAWDELLGLRLPLAVIVDRAGRIAWRGHPFNGLQPALAAVLADDKAALDEVVAGSRALADQLNPLVADLVKYANTDGMERRCCEIVDQLVALDARLSAPYLSSKYVALVRLKQAEEAKAWGRRLVDELLHDEEALLNELAWTIVDPKTKVPSGDVELARLAAERSNELAGGRDAAILDTLARVRWREGQRDEAIALQSKAVELAWTADMRKELHKTLDEYQQPAAPAGG